MPNLPPEIEKLRELLARVGALPISRDWMYSSIRHCERNMDFDIEDGGNMPERQCGDAIAEILNTLPDLLALIQSLTERERVLVDVVRELMAIIDLGVSVNISDEELRSAHPEDRRFIKRTRKALEAARAALSPDTTNDSEGR